MILRMTATKNDEKKKKEKIFFEVCLRAVVLGGGGEGETEVQSKCFFPFHAASKIWGMANVMNMRIALQKQIKPRKREQPTYSAVYVLSGDVKTTIADARGKEKRSACESTGVGCTFHRE